MYLEKVIPVDFSHEQEDHDSELYKLDKLFQSKYPDMEDITYVDRDEED